jgi:hypothetical protein
MDSYSLREVFRDGLGEHDIKARALQGVVASRAFIEKHRKLPAAFNVKALGEVCRGRTIRLTAADAHLYAAAGYRSKDDYLSHVVRAGEVTTSLFPILAGDQIINMIRAAVADDSDMATAMQLVTPMRSDLADESIPGVNGISGFGAVPEGTPYPQGTLSEDSVKIGYQKFGEIIAFTEETVRFDHTGQIVMEAQNIARRAGKQKVRHIVEHVTDVGGDTYRPSGTAEALYSTVARAGGVNKVTGNTLATSANLKTVRSRLAKQFERDPVSVAMGKKRYANIPLNLLLVPDALYDLALQLTGSILDAKTDNVANKNLYFNKRVLSHPILDEVSESTWYGGDPQSQFVLKTVKELEVLRVDGANSGGHRTGVEFDIRVSEWYKVGARSYEFFIQSTT